MIEVMLESGLRQFEPQNTFWRSLAGEKVKWIECNGHPCYIGKRCAVIFTAWAVIGGPQSGHPTLVFEDETGCYKQPLPNGPVTACENIYDEILLEVVK